MKKFACLLMVATLALTLSIAVFARYEACPECGGRMKESVKKVKVGTTPCEITGDESMLDNVYDITYTFKCSKCDYDESYTEYGVVICNH